MNYNKIKPIKTLQTIRQGKIGGGESHVLSLVSLIDRDKYEPIVLSFTDGAMIERVQDLGIKAHVVHTTKPFNYFISKKVNKIIEEEKIKLIHAHGTRAASNTFWSASKFNIPILYTVHAWSFHPALSQMMFRARVMSEKFLTNKVSKTICVSNANQQQGEKEFKLTNSTVIENGVELKRFNPSNITIDVKKELNLPLGKTIVGYIVRMTKQKSPMDMLKAISAIKTVNTNIHFLFVGDGDMKDEVYKRAQELDILDMITFEGFRTDIPNILHAIDIYVLPSLWEGLPIGILEAMAMEKPIIASEIQANSEIVHHQENGLVFPTGDVAKLVEQILELHLHPELRLSMGENGAHLVKNKYSLNKMVNKIEIQYENIYKQN